MKKILSGLFLLLILVTGCSNAPEPDNSNKVLLMVNTEGIGSFIISEGETAEAGDPIQSFGSMVDKGAVFTLSSEEKEDWKFVKWTKDGQDYAKDPIITVTVDDNVEYMAVFSMSTGYDGPSVERIEDAEVMGDILALPSFGSACVEGKVVQAFELDGVAYRAIAKISADEFDQLMALDILDPAHDQLYNALVAPLKIDHIVNVTEQIPSQEELDQLIGKTGAELLEEGWIPSFYNADEKTFGLDHGYFSYVMTFEGKVSASDDLEEALKPLKVVSLTYDGYGDVADPMIED